MNLFTRTFLLFTALLALMIGTAQGQTFSITSAGEINLDTNIISVEGSVTKYFGMYVDGMGDSTIKVRIGDQSFDRTYEFQLTTTRMVSYLFSNELAEDVSYAFRRGVLGTITVDIVDSSGVLNASTTFNVSVTRPKRNCKKYKSKRLKKCARVDLSKATAAQRLKLARVFAESIRGPIVLEP